MSLVTTPRGVAAVGTVVGALVLSACGGDDEPTPYTADDGSFSVLFPGEPELASQTTDIAGVDVELEFYVYERDDAAFVVNHYDYAPLADGAGVTTEQLAELLSLDDAAEGALSGVGATDSTIETIEVEGREGREIEFSGSDGSTDFVGLAHVMSDGTQLYQVLAIGEPDTGDELEEFVASFDFLTDPQEVGG